MGLQILLAGVMRPLISSNVLMVDNSIHELWCLGLDNIGREFHPAAQVEVIYGTVREFVTNYLAENIRRVQIIEQLSVNNSVQFWGVPNQGEGGVLQFLCDLQARVKDTGWGIGNYSNRYWVRIIFDANRVTNVS